MNSNNSVAPVETIALEKVMRGIHRVEAGDCLAKIADRYGRDFKELARINGIRAPYVIKVGQFIALSKIDRAEIAPSSVVKKTAVARVQSIGQTSPTLRKQHTIPEQLKESVRNVNQAATKKQSTLKEDTPKISPNSAVAWVWPTQGKITSKFQDKSTNKGIQIANKLGTPIHAVKSGKVVYSGQGLRGYGRLLIIKHDDNYLSAYAHNQTLLVKEGQYVHQGQTIATMGQTDASHVNLHFELRYKGKPVDPLRYLSKDRG